MWLIRRSPVEYPPRHRRSYYGPDPKGTIEQGRQYQVVHFGDFSCLHFFSLSFFASGRSRPRSPACSHKRAGNMQAHHRCSAVSRSPLGSLSPYQRLLSLNTLQPQPCPWCGRVELPCPRWRLLLPLAMWQAWQLSRCALSLVAPPERAAVEITPNLSPHEHRPDGPPEHKRVCFYHGPSRAKRDQTDEGHNSA